MSTFITGSSITGPAARQAASKAMLAQASKAKVEAVSSSYSMPVRVTPDVDGRVAELDARAEGRVEAPLDRVEDLLGHLGRADLLRVAVARCRAARGSTSIVRPAATSLPPTTLRKRSVCGDGLGDRLAVGDLGVALLGARS